MVKDIWKSDAIDEVYADDDTLFRTIKMIFQRHLAVEERLREEAGKRLRHLEFGSTEYDVHYRRVMDELRAREGLT